MAQVEFVRGWVTARMEEDGRVTTVVHGLAKYGESGRTAVIDYPVEADGGVERAFREVLERERGRLIREAERAAMRCLLIAEEKGEEV